MTTPTIDIRVNPADEGIQLGELRAGLRQQMLASPLMNAARFAKNVDLIYRRIWQEWCTL